MQPKLKAGGIRLRIRFLNLNLIINGDLVIAMASLIIIKLSLVIIPIFLMILDLQVLGSVVMVHMANQ